MKKLLTLMFPGFVIALFIFSACSKSSSNNNPPPKTKTELISQGSWKFKSATVNGSDASALIQACQRDNIVVFAAAGTGNVNEGPTKCNASDPSDIPFTWSFQNSETVLVVSSILFQGGSNTFQLEAVNTAQLVVSQGFSIGPGPVRNVIITFDH